MTAEQLPQYVSANGLRHVPREIQRRLRVDVNGIRVPGVAAARRGPEGYACVIILPRHESMEPRPLRSVDGLTDAFGVANVSVSTGRGTFPVVTVHGDVTFTIEPEPTGHGMDAETPS